MQFPEDIENTVGVLRLRYTDKHPYLYCLLLALVVGVIVALPLVHVDISSRSVGVVRQKENNTPMATIVSGRVMSSKIINNEKVSEGDTILLLDKSSVQAQTNEQRQLLRDIDAQIADLEILCNGRNGTLKTQLYRQELATYEHKTKSLETQNAQYKREYERSRQAYNEGLLSEKDYVLSSDQYQDGVRNLDLQRGQQMSTWQSTLRQLREQRQNLSGELQRTTRDFDNYALTAPTTGTLVCENSIQKGAYVNAGQTLCVISPDDSLIVECYVSPSDIGFLHLGQDVKLQYSAFNYNQWGMGHGSIIDIDKNLTTQGETPCFVVRCKMNERSLFLKNGYEARIKKGMFVTAHFQLTRRTLWQLLWDKVDDWFNPNQKDLEK